MALGVGVAPRARELWGTRYLEHDLLLKEEEGSRWALPHGFLTPEEGQSSILKGMGLWVTASFSQVWEAGGVPLPFSPAAPPMLSGRAGI